MDPGDVGLSFTPKQLKKPPKLPSMKMLVLGFLIGATLIVGVLGLLVMLAWNLTGLGDFTGLGDISYWQSVGALIVGRLLVGSPSPPKA